MLRISCNCRSLGQPGFAQALFESREVLRPASREKLPDIRNPKRRIKLAQTPHGFVRLIEPPGERVASCNHARRAGICLLAESLLRPRRCFVIAASVEMTGANVSVCESCERIDRAETDGARCAFDCNLGFAEKNVDPAAQQPSHG